MTGGVGRCEGAIAVESLVAGVTGATGLAGGCGFLLHPSKAMAAVRASRQPAIIIHLRSHFI